MTKVTIETSNRVALPHCRNGFSSGGLTAILRRQRSRPIEVNLSMPAYARLDTGC